MTEYISLVATVFVLYALWELLIGKFHTRHMSAKETFLDIAAFMQATVLVGPLIVFGTAAIERWLIPEYKDALIGTPWYLKLLCFLVFEDMVQYWYHRATHKFGWMWGFHKFHHTPVYMGVRIIWRNSFLYDLMMPNLWFAGVMVYLGFGDVYFWYYLVKLFVTMGAHSETRWDQYLYRYKALHPVAWVVERTISTPATHFAHHAYAEDDGIGHYNGNFGNLLFFWDVLFGTARITRQYPPRYGVPVEPGMEPDPWYVLIFYPFFRNRKKPSGEGLAAPSAQ
jgi:sterol desaturase/sphingolipid hydroxylase (fatty acid hydroxylase superfamily)